MLKLFEQRVKKAIKDPGKLYKTPEDVLYDPRLSRAQKERILVSWAEDTKALLRAEDENMEKVDTKRSPATLLQDIQKAEQTLHGTAA